MLRILYTLKKSLIWSLFIEHIFYPLYHFFWSYIINFKGKILFFLWSFKKKDYFSLHGNDKLITEPFDESKVIAKNSPWDFPF